MVSERARLQTEICSPAPSWTSPRIFLIRLKSNTLERSCDKDKWARGPCVPASLFDTYLGLKMTQNPNSENRQTISGWAYSIHSHQRRILIGRETWERFTLQNKPSNLMGNNDQQLRVGRSAKNIKFWIQNYAATWIFIRKKKINHSKLLF